MKKFITLILMFFCLNSFGQLNYFFWAHNSGTIPTVTTTTPITSITDNSASGGGTVVSDGGFPTTTYGLCWNTSTNPTTANNKAESSLTISGPFGFTQSLTGLASSTLYYVRAYATNAIGTAYGDNVTFTTLETFYSAAIYANYRKNDCSEGYHGTLVLVDFAYGDYTSYSQVIADNLAQAEAQAYANANGSCEADFWNEETGCSASRNNCGVGYHSPETYEGGVSAHSISSIVSVADANAQAYAQCASDMQAYANANGSCVADEITYYSAAISATYTRDNCAACYSGNSGTVTIGYGTYTSTVSQAAVDATAQAAAQAYANANFSCYYSCIGMVSSGLKTININKN